LIDLMRVAHWREAECLALPSLGAIEQSTIDEGRWSTAWLFTHLPQPPWQKIARQPLPSSEKPDSRIFDPIWVAAVTGYLKDLSTLNGLKRKNLNPCRPNLRDDDNHDEREDKTKTKAKGKAERDKKNKDD